LNTLFYGGSPPTVTREKKWDTLQAGEKKGTETLRIGKVSKARKTVGSCTGIGPMKTARAPVGLSVKDKKEQKEGKKTMKVLSHPLTFAKQRIPGAGNLGEKNLVRRKGSGKRATKSRVVRKRPVRNQPSNRRNGPGQRIHLKSGQCRRDAAASGREN